METAIKMGLVFKGNTLQELASAIGVDASALQTSFDRYNQLCAAGRDEDFGKDPSLLKAYGSGPYYAIKAYFYPYGSGGGLDVDTQIRVLKADHKTPINGLYAAGGDSLGVLMSDEKNYTGLGGPANGWAYFSGYIAGESCANYVYSLNK
jgi:fumarate reductase flavoprotein subunit